MALRLGDWVVEGELINTRKNSVHGWLRLRDHDAPLALHLTGNCDPDLTGRHIRFTARPSDAPEIDLPQLAPQQIGPTGTMTAARRVRDFDCSTAEYYRRAELGEPPPTEWKLCLYLEWHGQNGRVVVELVDPEIEFIDDAPAVADGDIPFNDIPFDDVPFDDAISFGEAEEGFLDSNDAEDDLDALLADEEDLDDEADEEEDPYGLFSPELLDHLDREATRADETLAGDGADDTIRELELMDALIERGEDVPVGSLFDPPMRLPSVEQLEQMSDKEAEAIFKTLLARLALYGVALDMCEHYTPRAAYRLLVEQIGPEEGVFPELQQTQWVQHFMTHEFCDQCDAEFEEQWDREQNDE
jgi:hypothetical protein